MKKLLTGFALLFALFSLTRCTDPVVHFGTLNLRMNSTWQGEDLVIGETYTDNNGRPILVEQFRMYVSNVAAVKADGSLWYIKEVDQINFDENWSAAMELPAGEYTGIQFGVGVPAEMNTDRDPAQYPSEHPLSIQSSEGMFWTWNSGYIFVKFEGKTALDGDASNMTDSYAFHVGADSFYRTLTVDKAFTVGEDDATVTVVADAYKFLEGSDDSIDLSEDYLTHTMNNMPLAERFMALFTDGFSAE